ncbi:amino acid transporter [Acidipropionibacterium jensenii]|uniref:LysE/ArgO family amino acid transporter n=1 Tax=Acidipropionibacterium jensenii TaxID=1749 RepID=UPI000BC34793|nr:LysE/ArgO family amino acid transporter [Acidipropionibacterium jensenii]AZZ41964.1 amino acid transporter [Acidipropionibacterium jensenii]
MSTYLAGLATGLGLIIAIGAQNAFVIRQGLRRDQVAAVVAICFLSDVVFICAGTAGIGALMAHADWLLVGLRWVGAAYLTWFGVSSLRQAAHPGALEARGPTGDRRAVLLGCLAVTWLNPHVYLDTVVMLGTIANQHGHPGRWVFAAGAATGSLTWFAVLGFGARALAEPLSSPRVWRGLDLAIGLMMLYLAVRLLLG